MSNGSRSSPFTRWAPSNGVHLGRITSSPIRPLPPPSSPHGPGPCFAKKGVTRDDRSCGDGSRVRNEQPTRASHRSGATQVGREKAMLDFLAKGLMVIILLAWVFRRERNDQ